MKQSNVFPGSDHEEKVLCLILKNLKKRVFIIKKHTHTRNLSRNSRKLEPFGFLIFPLNVTNDTKTTFFFLQGPIDAYVQFTTAFS